MKISAPAMFLQAFQNGGIQDKKRHMSGKIEVPLGQKNLFLESGTLNFAILEFGVTAHLLYKNDSIMYN